MGGAAGVVSLVSESISTSKSSSSEWVPAYSWSLLFEEPDNDRGLFTLLLLVDYSGESIIHGMYSWSVEYRFYIIKLNTCLQCTHACTHMHAHTHTHTILTNTQKDKRTGMHMKTKLTHGLTHRQTDRHTNFETTFSAESWFTVFSFNWCSPFNKPASRSKVYTPRHISVNHIISGYIITSSHDLVTLRANRPILGGQQKLHTSYWPVSLIPL